VPALPKSSTDLSSLITDYHLYAQTKSKSKNTITIVTRSISYLDRFPWPSGI